MRQPALGAPSGGTPKPADREAAFHQMYLSYYQHIAAYTHRRTTAEDAEDIVAETFLVAWRRLEDVPEGDLTLAWLYGVARRVLSEGRRSRWRRERLAAKLGRLRGRPDTSAYDRLGEHEVVHQALARLRPNDRELLRLAEWEDLTHAELAVALACSVNAVTIRLHRAHRRFAAALQSLDEASAVVDRGAEGQPE